MNILIDFPVYEPLLNSLKKIPGVNIDITSNPLPTRPRLLPENLIKKCNAILCYYPPENHREMHDLKYIQISSSGYYQLINQGFEKRGVIACNSRGVSDTSVSEWNIAMIINLARDLRSMIRNQESGRWDRCESFQKEIRGSTLGIWGYGGIARETARLAKALGMKVHVLTRSGARQRKNVYLIEGTGDPDGILPDKVFLMNEKEEFLSNLDFLLMAIPQTDKNVGIIGEAELKKLPPRAFIINSARGLLIQEKALLKALKEGWISGAALDAHYYYPMPPDHPLWTMPNVIMTPHIGQSGAIERCWDIFVQNIIRFQRNQPLLNELSASELIGD